MRVRHGFPTGGRPGQLWMAGVKPTQWRGASSGRSKAGRTSSPAAGDPALRERAAARAAARARPTNRGRDGGKVQRQSAGPSTSSPAAILGAATRSPMPCRAAGLRKRRPKGPVTMPQPAAAPSRPAAPCPPSRLPASPRCSSPPPNPNCPADRFPDVRVAASSTLPSNLAQNQGDRVSAHYG